MSLIAVVYPLADIVEPVSVILKFAIVAILYLFLAWVAKATLSDLHGLTRAVTQGSPTDAAVLPPTHGRPGSAARAGTPRLRVERAIGHNSGDEYDVLEGFEIGRGNQVAVKIDDPYASSRHAKVAPIAGAVIVEDLGSTNGTFLNEEPLVGPQPLQFGDRIRIGDTEFTYLND